MIFSVVMLTLSGCGGGGGGSTPAVVVPPGTPTSVSGTPFKGAFDGSKPSEVKIFGVDANNIKAANPLVTPTKLDIDGKYGPVNIGTYTGTIVVEVTGTYKDEATGLPVTIKPADPPLRAIISDAKGGDQVVNVTPLTELAARKMGDVLTKPTIDSRNASIAALFNVADIFKTKPVDATNAAASAAALPEEIKQSLVLAAISQLMTNATDPTTGLPKTLGQVLDVMSADITVDAANPANVAMKEGSTLGFKTAMLDFVTVNPLNQSGVKSMDNAPILSTPPNVIASKVAHMKISTAGLAPGSIIGGIEFTLNLPAGVTLINDPTTFEVAPGVVVASGVAAVTGTNRISTATFHLPALKILLANAQGFGAGEFINISCTIPATVTTSVAALKTAFTTAIKAASATVTATDLKGAPILGVTLAADPADPAAIVVF